MIFKSKREQFAIDGKKFHPLYERDVEAKEKKVGCHTFLGYALEWDLIVVCLSQINYFKSL
jgi:hypothetical protein